MKSKTKVVISICLFFSVTLVIAIGGYWINKQKKIRALGIKAVNYLYSFDTPYDLAESDIKLKQMSTDSAYKQMTVTNSSTALNVYLKLNKSACKVKIKDVIATSKSGIVYYSLESDSIECTRMFMFMYKVKGGKIDEPVQAECYTFPQEEEW